MAIYHLSAKIISRADGRSVVAAAAYRAGESLREESTGITFDYTRKQGVAHTEIVAPEGAPDWVHDRLTLWNAVDRAEKRRDAQLAREIEVGLPVELDDSQQLALARDFVRRQFVSQGMVADLAIHRYDDHNPHAHILLTTRRLGGEIFGLKERSWNARAKLLDWRIGWEEVTNTHLAQAGLAIRIDHRTLKAQGLDLAPGRKIGVGRERRLAPNLPDRVAERIAEQQRIALENGERILAEPAVALSALTRTQATFTEHDLARFLHTRTDGADQFRAAHLKVMASEELVALGRDERGQIRYTSRELLALESEMLRRAERMVHQRGHAVAAERLPAALANPTLSAEQRAAIHELAAPGDLKGLVGLAGSGKSRLLGTLREAWEGEGYTVKGAALSGIAAESLQEASGIRSRTLAGYEYAWQAGRDPLTPRDILIIDEAGMVGTRQLARMLARADAAGAKVVLVGDPEQLQAIEAGAPFRGILAQSGMAELTEVRRQSQDWQREATRQLATGATAQALEAYHQQGGILQVPTRDSGRSALLARWAHDRQAAPGESRLMLAYTRDDVRELNIQARTLRLQAGELGRSESIETTRGAKDLAVGDRLYFLRNERSLGVKNGSLGTIEDVRGGVLQVRLDTPAETRIAVDTRWYRDLDYGYAATIHKAQGATVDRTYVLATPHFDRHATYVALSRHRESATVFYAASDFGAGRLSEPAALEQAHQRMVSALSRARTQELVHDYLDREPTAADVAVQPTHAAHPTPASMSAIDALQQQAADRWRQRQLEREHDLDTTFDPALPQQHSQTHQPDASPRHRKEHVHSRSAADDLDI
ncbi:MAG: Ti-type conjugative transfer relaxase TraA [Steroidobacteraceae bacterium]